VRRRHYVAVSVGSGVDPQAAVERARSAVVAVAADDQLSSGRQLRHVHVGRYQRAELRERREDDDDSDGVQRYSR